MLTTVEFMTPRRILNYSGYYEFYKTIQQAFRREIDAPGDDCYNGLAVRRNGLEGCLDVKKQKETKLDSV